MVTASLHPDEERANRLGALKKWDEYLNRKNVGQERLSRLQYVGRSGLPGIPRYTAHDRCLNAEEFTQSIIDNYSHVDDMTKMNQGNTQLDHLKQDIMVNMPLNDFYDRAKNYFPIDYPKYPAFQPRVKSAPLQDADSFAKLEVTEKRSKSARRRSHKKEEAPWVLSRPIKLDTIVNLIDSVTDEMQEYKERMTPEPLPGFRQPAIKFNINERPLTAPFTGLKPPDGLVHPSQQWKPAFLTETHVAEPHVPITSINVLYDDFPSKHLANLPCSACLNVPTSPMKGRLTSALVRMSVTDSRTLLKHYVYVQPTRAVTKQIHLRNFH